MSARGTVGGVVASAAIIVIAWQVGQSTATASPSASASGTGSGTGSTSTGSSSPSASSTTSPSSSASSPAASPSTSPSTSTSTSTSPSASKPSVSGTFAGDTIQTPFGNMKVAIVVSGGKITTVNVLQATDAGQRSVQISSYADPVLTREVIKAQSANVQMVSGATYTSGGYLQSLQSALDKAGL